MFWNFIFESIFPHQLPWRLHVFIPPKAMMFYWMMQLAAVLISCLPKIGTLHVHLFHDLRGLIVAETAWCKGCLHAITPQDQIAFGLLGGLVARGIRHLLSTAVILLLCKPLVMSVCFVGDIETFSIHVVWAPMLSLIILVNGLPNVFVLHQSGINDLVPLPLLFPPLPPLPFCISTIWFFKEEILSEERAVNFASGGSFFVLLPLLATILFHFIIIL